MKTYVLLPAVVFIAFLCGHAEAQQVKSFRNGDATLFYEEFGSGPPLYVLSGGPGEPPDDPYRRIIDSLKSQYTCVLLHQRGSGLSRAVPVTRENFAIAKYVEDVALLRKARGDGAVALLGMSWGGLLAQSFAARYPKAVSNLILVCGASPSYKVWMALYDNQLTRRSQVERDSMRYLETQFAHLGDRALDSLKRVDPQHPAVLAMKAFMWIHIRAMYFDTRHISRPKFEKLFADFNFQPIAILDQEVMETQFDITADLKKLKVPALIVYGRQDDQGESTFFLQRDCLRNSEMQVIEQCGHEIVQEQPEAFFKILKDYLQRTSKK
ncbi:MAG: alpha/beta fold hydrolase [Bacteroidota bacterium]